ncbi:hypothetical protein BACCIP111895_03223 [Neobacillus rhizosphaerae]|uniref:DNA translocase FtsK 4TM region domain-containing protein n=1 Tax=Neobacillus rhizosphaerae TaxID=2880965 RepID=A0ABM9ETQ1_9BACI|nr:hypothetical protein [Neobacillus rhizosphaerae]CAH2716039.1 hypothetical protein BACCIP111895_03223 [Neobacillus rhizosphaerae]
MRKSTVYLVFCIMLMVLSIMGFILIDLSTIEPPHISGNGNIAILFMVPTVLFYLLFLFNLFRWSIVAACEIKLKHRLHLIILLVIALIILIFVEVDFINNLVHLLGGGPEEPKSRIYRFGWYNQYTNTIYFNWITFCMGMVLSAFFALFFGLLKKQIAAKSNLRKQSK